MSVTRNYINSLRYKTDEETCQIYADAIGPIDEYDDFEKEETAAEVRAIITADTLKQAVYLADDKFCWGNPRDCVCKLWKEIGRLEMPPKTHANIVLVAEALTDKLARDREELANFVTEALLRCYQEDPDSFYEDWERYVVE